MENKTKIRKAESLEAVHTHTHTHTHIMFTKCRK